MKLLIPLLLSLSTLSAAEPLTLKLWPKGAPGAPGFRPKTETNEVSPKDGVRRIGHVSDPTMTVYRAARPNGTAVVVCPGGGYKILAYEHEGSQVCEWLNDLGVTAILLKYRVPARSEADPSKEPLQDAQRAIGMIRQRSKEWGINPDRIGILGFSAGGHLAAMATFQSQNRTYTREPNIEVEVVAPNFAILIYPAYLVGKDTTFTLKPEFQVTSKSPPICLIHAHDDKGATSPSASALLYLEYKKLNLPAELHIYTKGGHGFGMKKKGLPSDYWSQRAGDWMQSMGWLEKS